MDQELRAILTAPRIGCTQEHIAAFEKEGILKASDVRLLTDPDFSAMHIGIATKNRVMAAMQQHAAGVGSEALQRAPPVQTHIGDFIYSPPVAAAAAATHSSTRPAASSKASRDGQRGGKQKAANVNTAKQLAGTMNVFLSGGRKKSPVTAAATTTASKACSEKAKVPVDMPTMETVESDPSSEDETEASSSTRPIVRPKAGAPQSNAAGGSQSNPAGSSHSPNAAGTSQSMPDDDDERWTLDQLVQYACPPAPSSPAPPAPSSPAPSSPAPSSPAASPPPATPPPAAAASVPPPTSTAATFAARLGAIADLKLREIVRLFATPGSKAVSYTAGSTTLSAPLRKLYAEYSREAVTSSLQQRGLKPTVRAVRQAVELVGGHWPWAGKSIDADVQVLRNARRALDAKEFDDVDTQVSPMPPPCPQHCPPLARLAHCCSRDAPKTLHCCSARTLRGSRVSSRHPELPPAICTLTCTTPHPTPDLTGRACIEAADAHWRIPWIPTVARGRGGSFGAVGRD